MGERDDAQREIADARERLTFAASELARRASPRYLGAKAKEAAREKATEWGDDMVTSPIALGMLGSLAGGLIGAAIARSAKERKRYSSGFRRSESLEADDALYAYGDETGGIELDEPLSAGGGRMEAAKEKMADVKDRALDKKDELKEKARSAVENVKDRATGLRERLPSRYELQGKVRGAYDRGVEEQPLLLAAGALALGAAIGLLVPESRAEQRALSSPRQKVREKVQELNAKVGEKLEAMASPEQRTGEQERGEPLSESGMGAGTLNPRPSGSVLGSSVPGLPPPGRVH
jgi:hypothetical protein